MAWHLLKAGKTVCIFDNGYEGSSTTLAAGIVNPITGKNFVRSWRIHELLPVAREVYIRMSEDLGASVFTERNIIRSLYTVEDENNWIARTKDPAVAPYILSVPDDSEFRGKVFPPLSYGEMTGTFQVHMKSIIEGFRLQWKTDGIYFQEKFDYSALVKEDRRMRYKDIILGSVIFCEGYQALENPFFHNIGMRPSKGEVLFVRIPGKPFSKMYKDGVFMVPQLDDIYWIGGGYENNPPHDYPSEKGYAHLESELKRILNTPYHIVDHRAAIRPTMARRRPIIQKHEEWPELYMFNGLGTKGASLGPFFSRHLTRYLLHRDPADLVIER